MPDFTDILNKKAEAVEKPKPKPTGTYQAMIQGMPAQNQKMINGEEVPIISFNCKLMSPLADVDADQLEASGDMAGWPPFRREFWLNGEQGVFALKTFLENVLEIDPAGKTLGQMCGEAPGKQLAVKLKHRPYTDKTSGQMEIATDIESTAKL